MKGAFAARSAKEPADMKPNQSATYRLAAWKAAEKAGHDMSLIESNLRKTPYQRIRAHSRALATAVMLRQAMAKRHARP